MIQSIPDAMWNAIQHLFLGNSLKGRKTKDPRHILDGILYVLHCGIPWRRLPSIYGPKSTVHAAFMRWSRANKFQKIHELFTNQYVLKNEPSYFAIDAALTRARCGGDSLGDNPCDRRKKGVKRTIVADEKGVPLLCMVTPANRHDIVPARLLIGKIKELRPSSKIAILAADSGYDARNFKQALVDANIAPFITQNSRRGKVHDRKLLSKNRWIVEASHSWLNNYRSVATRYAKHNFAYAAFVSFACAVMVFERLNLCV
jgi:transposase